MLIHQYSYYMEFKENSKPIYQQIADRISDEVMTGKYAIDSRIPSVREYAGAMAVNANTVMRTYEYLQNRGVIYNKRGIGFFISPDAVEKINRERAETFYKDEMVYFFSRLKKIGVTPAALVEMYRQDSE